MLLIAHVDLVMSNTGKRGFFIPAAYGSFRSEKVIRAISERDLFLTDVKNFSDHIRASALILGFV